MYRKATATVMRVLVTCLVLTMALNLSGCKDKGSRSMFETLVSSDFGLGISLGMGASEVEAVLGPATIVPESSGGSSEHYYLNSADITISRDTPQLCLTYKDDSLCRIYNRYYPEQAEAPRPPFFIEVLPGVKLGARQSDFFTQLGNPTTERLGKEWRYQARDGRTVAVLVGFTQVESTGTTDNLCSILLVSLADTVEMPQGEFEDERTDKRDFVE